MDGLMGRAHGPDRHDPEGGLMLGGFQELKHDKDLTKIEVMIKILIDMKNILMDKESTL